VTPLYIIQATVRVRRMCIDREYSRESRLGYNATAVDQVDMDCRCSCCGFVTDNDEQDG